MLKSPNVTYLPKQAKYIKINDMLDLRDDEELPVVLIPAEENEYSLEKNMFSAYPLNQQVPYAESGSWIGGYNE